MAMPRRKPTNPVLMLLLFLYVAVSGTYQTVGTISTLTAYFDVRHQVTEPFQVKYGPKIVSVGKLAAGAGLAVGDTLVTLGGKPYTARFELQAARFFASPSETLQVGVRKPDGRVVEIRVPLEGYTIHDSLAESVFFIFLNVAVPLGCLLVGYRVVIARPSDWNAWLILVILTYPQGFISLATYNWWPWWLPLRLGWHVIVVAMVGPALLWLAACFPEKSHPGIIPAWMRWAITGIQVFGTLAGLFADYLNWYTPRGFTLAERIDRFNDPMLSMSLIVSMAAYGLTIHQKVQSERNPDSLRRLKILAWGSLVGLGSTLLLWGVLPFFGPSPAKIKWLGYLSACLLVTFPLSLAYVVVVQRAMDVRLLLRIGTQYVLARTSVTLLQIGVITYLIWKQIVPFMEAHPKNGTYVLVPTLILVVVIRRRFLRRGIFDRLRDRVDRHFFREAYNAELVLGDLVDRVRSITEPMLLLETVSKRVSEVLHVSRMAVLVRHGDCFRAILEPQTAGTPLILLEASRPIRHLALTRGPAVVYREDPEEWLVEASEEERAAIDHLNPEVLLPLPGRTRLMGVMALGAKRSEEPYSAADLRLLASVASQTGLGLEVNDLAETLAREAAGKERMQREMEIAREVQERLFPQRIPQIPGVDLAGHCRPALGVGGDYYDMIGLEDGRLALAVGDVSGKGIGAALLMASLRASLRGMTDGNSHDLARMVRKLNRLVYEASSANRYATFFFAIYDPRTRMLEYVNGGHNAPAILRCGEVLRLEATGMVVGLLPDVEFEQASVQMQPGDTFLAYTDGISEAMTIDDEEWEDERMLACARANHGSAAGVLRALFAGADAFTAGAPQHDDMTVLILKVA